MSQGPEGCTRLWSRAGGVGVYGVEVPSSSTPAEDFLWRGGALEPPAGGAQVALSAPWPSVPLRAPGTRERLVHCTFRIPRHFFPLMM